MKFHIVTKRVLSVLVLVLFCILAVGSVDGGFDSQTYDPNSAAAIIFKEELNVPVVYHSNSKEFSIEFSKVKVTMSGDQDDKRIFARSSLSIKQNRSDTLDYFYNLNIQWYQKGSVTRSYPFQATTGSSSLSLKELCFANKSELPDSIVVTCKDRVLVDTRN